MHPEPESTSSPDVLGTHAEIPANSENDSSLSDLDPTESGSRSSADEAAAAIDLELDEAVKRSIAQQNRQRQDEPIENLYASLLQEDAPASDPQSADEVPPLDLEPEIEPEAGNFDAQMNRSAPDSSDGLDAEISKTPLVPERQEAESGSGAPVDPAPEILESSPTPAPSVTSSLEQLLSNRRLDAQPDEIDSGKPDVADGMEIISALTDLIPEDAKSARNTEAETTVHTWEALQVNPEAPLTEDDYLLASPEEDLLSGEANEPLLEQEQNLRLDSSTMEQLESDLDRLEDSEKAIAQANIEGDRETETSSPIGELSDEDLDAIFPAFLLAEPSEEALNDTQVDDRETADIAPSSAQLPPEKLADTPPPKSWYLGLDFGTTGLCAVLLNRLTGALYPVYWLPQKRQGSRTRIFRLPATVCVSRKENPDGTKAIEFAASNDRPIQNPDVFWLQHFKSWLNLGLPWQDDDGRGQPEIQLSEHQRISLADIQRACQVLFSTIEAGVLADSRFGNPEDGWPEEIPIPVSPHLPVSPFPLPSMSQAIEQLAGAIVNAPVGASEAYRFNVREALLGTNLVRHPGQVVFVEDAIATVLSALHGDPIAAGNSKGWELLPERPGTTLAIDAGATTTELVLVDFPDRLEDLSPDDFKRHSFPYGGDAIDRDIICQLLLDREEVARAVGLDDTVLLPQPGEPDLETGIAFDRWVQSSPSRRSLGEAAKVLKLVLQDQERHTLNIESVELTVMRRDLEARVLVPYIQQVNRELNVLLSQAGVAVEGIDRALCTGGNASWQGLALWLRQKLPNAIVMQDVYPSDRPTGCSRVAYGLATLPLYPQVLDELPQQYNDYFLVRELLEVCPDRALSVREIIALLESRGLNVRACRSRILAILAGQLPLGLVPRPPHAAGLNPSSQQHPVYRALSSAPLFYAENARTYRPNREQFDRLRQYFAQVTVNSAQTWQEPLAIGLGISKS